MIELFRETACGQLIRLVTRNKYLQYPEEKNPELWRKFVNKDKSSNMARYGQPDEPQPENEDDEKKDDDDDNDSSEKGGDSADPASAEDHRGVERQESRYNDASGVKVDPEKGKDVTMIDWDGDDDPNNPLNWSQSKKFFVTFLICLLTFAVYVLTAKSRARRRLILWLSVISGPQSSRLARWESPGNLA